MNLGGSLRGRLLAGVLAVVTVAWLVVALSAYREARHEVDELLDAHLVQSAALLSAQIGDDDGEIEIESLPAHHRYERKVAFQVWDGPQLRVRSAAAPESRLSHAGEGFSSTETGGRPWRVYSLRHRGLTLQVAERREGRDKVAAEIAEHLLAPLAIGLPLLGLALAYAIRRGLRPLTILAAELAGRDPERLEPIADDPVPAEIKPLVDRLNHLFRRIRDTLGRERQFTADASHELRTPIAAIRAQAEVARNTADPAERGRALDSVIKGCDRATHLIGQLLTLARVDSGPPPTASTCDLTTIAAAFLAELGPWAHDRGISVELDSRGPLTIRSDPALLGVLLRNLVDNAVRYSPAGTTVTVRVTPDDAGARIEVVDQGPGIPAEERGKAVQRFYRLDGTAEGSGLGLSIAVRIAELSGARLDFRQADPAPGLCVAVTFPRSRQADGG